MPKTSKIMSVLAERPPLASGAILVTQTEFNEYAEQLRWFWSIWTGQKQMPLTEAKFRGHPLMVDTAL